jgi:hypothetical protein
MHSVAPPHSQGRATSGSEQVAPGRGPEDNQKVAEKQCPIGKPLHQPTIVAQHTGKLPDPCLK